MSPNDYVKIKCTESGWKQIAQYVTESNEEMLKRHPKITMRYKMPVPDKDGYIRDQFWCLMRYFNWDKLIGSECPFSDMKLEGK